MTGLRRVLVANRGEIAVRIVRACRDEGLESIALVSAVDRESLPAQLADGTVEVGARTPGPPYLSVPAVVSAALMRRCDAVHPGYGFLAERPELADACDQHGLVFVGPSAEAIRRGGDKVEARALAVTLDIPVGTGSTGLDDPAAAAETASTVGYPVLLKAAAGGGGRGMTLVEAPEHLTAAFERAHAEALGAFGDGRLYVERYVSDARHVEVQILADRHGSVIALGDRDCSYQRRYQKLIEEAPASAISTPLRQRLAEAAVRLVSALDYVGAATVEFLVDQQREDFVFLEINTRVQVEHPVTEAVTGVDIVREQLRVAGGAPLDFRQHDILTRGHSIEVRINAEDAAEGFRPSPGLITRWDLPSGEGIRVDTHCFEGYTVPAQYDSLLAKLIVHGEDRAQACERLTSALAQTQIEGPSTTVALHRAIVAHPDFQAGRVSTRWVEESFLPSWVVATS